MSLMRTLQGVIVLGIVGGVAYIVSQFGGGGGGGGGGAGSGGTFDSGGNWSGNDAAPSTTAPGSTAVTDPFTRTGQTASQVARALMGKEYSTSGTWEESATGTRETRRLYQGNLIPDPVEAASNVSDQAVQTWNKTTPDVGKFL